ncbi:MAG: chromosome segregation protein SMC, partial [Planctomycetes bacterium RBG_16_59_8]
MHLRKIELCGFKSFANRTEIAFNPGVTGIVGPNGCGKSNVVDAMKWVLGTLSPKSLRGDEMMDVIFKGGEGMGPAGFAEVSLTLDNSDKKLPIEFDEVSVTRRLYSSGESRYLINKAECRLKDVRELFYGTGIGTDNYAIIEQGKIDRLVMSNPSERRGVFEEAAGISRYRVKRRETSSKLDRVSQDLLRLGDVVREITRETRSIKAQAARAERCKQLQESLRIKKVQMALREYDQLAANLREIAAALDADQQTKYGIDASIAILRKTLQDSDAFLANMSREENESSAVLKEAEAQASELSRIIEGNNQRIEEISSQIERINLDREELSGRLEGVKGSIAEGKREQETNGSAIGNLEIQLEEVSAKLTCAVEECRSLAQNIDRKKSEIFALAQRHAQYRNERTQVSSTKEDLMRRRKRLDDRIQEVVNELAGGEQTAVASESIRNAVVGELDALAAHLKMEEESHRALRESLAQSDNEISVLKNTLNKLLSRRDLINEMEARLDGVGDGGKALLRQTDAAFPGILGTLSDFIDVAPEHLKMVEAALGEHATSLVAQDLSSALAAAEFIRKNNLPRVTILIKGLPPGDDPVGGAPADYVRAPEDFKGMIGRLFGSIRVVDTLADAGTALESGQTRTSFVSRDGDILRSDGSVSTGTSSGDNRVLSRKSELKTLSTELEQAQVEFDRRDRERASCMRMTSVSEEKMNVLRQQIYEKNIRKIEAERELEHILKRINVLREEDGYIRAEVTEVDTEIDSGTKNEARLEELIRGLDDLQESVKAEVARMTESLETYEATKAQLHQEETTHRVGLASAQQRRDEIVRRLAALVGEESAIEEKVREVADHHEKLSTRVTNLLLENKEKGDAFAEAEQRRVVLQKRIEEISSAIALERENGAMARQELDASVLSHSELERRLQDARMKENEARWKLESLK